MKTHVHVYFFIKVHVCMLLCIKIIVQMYKYCMGCKKRFNTAELFSLQVKILRTTPVFLGTIKNFYLYGEHEGDTFATGGMKHFLLLCILPYFWI